MITISIACYNNSDLTVQCLSCLKQNSVYFDDFQIILTDNASSDNTLKVINDISLPDKVVIANKENLGFGEAHNRALQLANKNYFLVLNNDMFMLEKGWDRALINALKAKEWSLVGIKGVNCTLREDATGYLGDRVDYIEGSFLAGLTSNFKKYGLFSPAIKMFVGEDSDLSLRYKQMGFALQQIPIKFRHVEHPTLDLIDSKYKSEIFKHNVNILQKRWYKYLKTKSFNNRILISIPSLGIGDILCATPTVEAIRLDHPTAMIEVETRFPEVFIGNPNINNHIMYNRAREDNYDRLVRLEPDFSLPTPLHESYEKAGATTLKSVSPQLYLTEQEINEASELLEQIKSKYKKIIVCSMLMKRVEWQGRNWTLKNAQKFIESLKRKCSDCGIIEVGKETASTGIADLDLVNQTTLRQLFAIIAQADVFVGIDSLPFHIAQAFKVNSVVLFGATKPESRIADASFIHPITTKLVRCVGCYHVKHQSVFNKCDRGDEACIRTITPEEVAQQVQKVIREFR